MKKRATFLAAVMIIGSVAAVASPSKAATHQFRITNGGDHQIDNVYISGVDRRRWGDDLLGDDFLEPGRNRIFDIGEGCYEDILVIYEDGHEDEEDDWDTCEHSIQFNY